MESLTPDRLYTIAIAAKNSIGNSNWVSTSFTTTAAVGADDSGTNAVIIAAAVAVPVALLLIAVVIIGKVITLDLIFYFILHVVFSVL